MHDYPVLATLSPTGYNAGMTADSSIPGEHFRTTHWSIVLAAGGSNSPAARTALEALCETYWYPIYAYIRRQGHGSASAQDLTQEFFARLLERNDLRSVHPERGRFRAFLRASIRHFLSNEWDKAKALKRGGGRRVLSLDFDEGERRYELEPALGVTPEILFDKRWALMLLDRVRDELCNEYRAAKKGDLVERLQPYLTGDHAAAPYAETARALGMTEAAVKVAVHRLRQRFRARLRQEIAQTVASPDEIDDEIRQLFHALRA